MNLSKFGTRTCAIIVLQMLIPSFANAKTHLHLKHDSSSQGFSTSGSAPAGATLTYYGHRVTTNLEVVQVLWGAGTYIPEVTSTGTPSMKSFCNNVLASPLIDWLTEYNTPASGGTNQKIGHGTFLGQFTITPSTTATTITDAVIESELTKQIAAGHLPRPSTDAVGNNNTYYAIFFPKGKIITVGTDTSCSTFCAYHGAVAATSSLGEFYYGVHPDFSAGSGCDLGCGSASTTFANLTSVVSHEMVETITDAEVGLAWFNNTYGEIGDICNAMQGTILGGDGQTYTVQMEYSNVDNNCIITRPIAPTITSANNATFLAGSSNTFSVTAKGTPAPTYSKSGTLPSGVTFSSSGVISGTPAAGTQGTYPITITAANGASPNATQTFSLKVQDFTVAVSPTTQSVTAGQSGTYTLKFASTTGLTGLMSISCTGGPTGSTCTTTPTSASFNGVSLTATATLKTPTTAKKATTSKVTFTGKIGNTTRSVTGTVTIK